MARARPTRVFVFGAGKVGTALARALRRVGFTVVLRARRRGVPARALIADLILLAVRDGEIEAHAEAFSRLGVRGRRSGPPTVLHCAGALGPEVLASCRQRGMAVAQMHPLLSFAGEHASGSKHSRSATPPSLRGATAYVRGDAAAVVDAKYLATRLGMVPRRLAGLPAPSYHAAAALVANGGAALCAAGIELLHASGVRRSTAAQMLGPLLRSVADNVEHLGMPGALTGPIRRGDLSAVEAHVAAIAADAPTLLPLYVEVARAQVELARALGEVSPQALDHLDRALTRSRRRLPKGGRGT